MYFKYTAYTPQNKIIKGLMEVADKEKAVQSLKRAGYNILSLKRSRQIKIEDALPSLFSVKKADVIMFSRQLAMLMEKGIRLLSAMALAKEQVKNRLFKKKLGLIISDIENGVTFSGAIEKYPDIFPLMYHNMMKVGEKTGKLESVLREIAGDMEQNEITKKKIRSAMIYPGVILSMGIGTVVIMVTTVLPTMTDLFSRFDAELPLPTRITMALAKFLTSYGIYLLGGMLVIALVLIWYSRKTSGKYYIEKFTMHLPVIGNIIFLKNLYQFSRIASILLSAGLPITEVISIAQQGVQSETIRRELQKIPANLMQGYGLSHSMRENTLFPSMLVQMVITGEETNTLESSFAALAEHYKFEFTQSLNTAISLLEPVMIAIIGLFIGFIAISVMMPMYSVYNVMF